VLLQGFKSVALSAVAGQMFLAGQASAAQEVAAIAGDNRTGLLLTLALPAVGWVLFNIAGPALNQLNAMGEKNKAIIAGAGLGAALLAGGSADAAQEIASMAGDNRAALLLTLALPAVGWVLFNIAGPALNQLNNMSDKKKAIIGGAGISAALLAGGSANAAQEIASLAGDNRAGLLLTLALPAVGWVLFNIAGPALNQLNAMGEKSKAVIGGAGISAALLAGGSADAAQEIASMAGDNRAGLLLTLALPAVGWVLFNIAGPALNQLNNMSDKK
jgi:photosystem II PsbY protein